jgi:hypothetical protein
LPTVISSAESIHSTGRPGSGGPGSSCSRSVPPICNFLIRGSSSPTGPGTRARACAPSTSTVIPGTSCAASHCAPRARRDTFRIRAPTHAE